MRRIMCKSKIHRAKVTQAELYYEGSLTVDQNLLDASDIIAYERVQVVNVNNGERFETYVIPGQRESGTICLNGAAARLGAVGDEIIIIAYGTYSDEELKNWKPYVVFVDKDNRIAEVKNIIEPIIV